jgi:endonuclease/exonuclease/phosphatase family metal-dependent hydrolase
MTITDHRGAVYPSDHYPVVATLSYTRPDTP